MNTTCPICGTANAPGAAVCSSCGAPLPRDVPAPHVLPPGTKLASGAYTVGRVLGQGGFGITYLGSDARQNRVVAIKELFPTGSVRQGLAVRPAGDWTTSTFAEAKQRFDQEARTLARFHHPNIVLVYSVFSENDTSYMVMEYLQGDDLEGVIEKRGGPLPEAEAVEHVRKVGEALTVVHGAGLLHRDVKPDNIILTEQGRIVLLDFGSAREYAAGRTRRMTAMLTPGYAPLEQYSQQARFGTFTDVYGLAATLYHLLTGLVPVASLDRIQGVELPPVRQLNPQVSEAAERAVMTGLAMEVAKRPQTVADFLALLPAPRAPAPPRRAPSPRPAAPAPAAPRPRPAPPREPVLLRELRGHGNWINSVAFSPDGTLLGSGSQDNTAIVWRSDTGEARHVLSGRGGPLLGALGAVHAVAFSPDGRLVASGGNDDTIYLWDTRSGELERGFTGYGGNVNALAFSPDGRVLASGTQLGGIELWDPWRGELLGTLQGHARSVMAVAFSGGGRILASGSEDFTAVLWQTASWEPQLRFQEHTATVRSVAFSPDGWLLATGSDDYQALVWDLQHDTLALRLDDHGGGVRSVAFSPDGRRLATGCDDMLVRLWDPTRGTGIATLAGHRSSVAAVAFSPAGGNARQPALLASGGMDQTICLWQA